MACHALLATYYLRLSYPLRIVVCAEGYHGFFPDLPGCEARDDDLPRLYARLETARSVWIARMLNQRECVPLPNTRRVGPMGSWG